jgi:Glycosyltransferase
VKILIVNTSDTQGGAARAAYRLHRALLVEGMGSQMLVQSKSSDDFTVIGASTKLTKLLATCRSLLDALPVLMYKNRTQTLFSPSWLPFSGMVKKINDLNPDVVHLHWICGGMLRIEDIAKIKAPIVWSLHDMWAFTGGDHYDEGAGNYLALCGYCKVLGSDKANDISRWFFKRKQKTYAKKSNMTIVGLSSWLNDCSKSSTLLKVKAHINLPNPIDTSIYLPLDKAAARDLLRLPQDKKLVLFGGMAATSDPRKGYKELSDALGLLKFDDIELVVFGGSSPKVAESFNFKTHYLGQLYDDMTLRVLYSAADVMVVPSIQENLSNAIMESLACATPVVAFDVGGNGDMVKHKENGYLARPFDTNDLAMGIEWILNAPNYNVLSASARNKVVREFDSRVVAKRYIKLYNGVIE